MLVFAVIDILNCSFMPSFIIHLFFLSEPNEEWSVHNYGSDTQNNLFDFFNDSSVLDRASESHGYQIRHNEKQVGHALSNTILPHLEYTSGCQIMKTSIYCNIM